MFGFAFGLSFDVCFYPLIMGPIQVACCRPAHIPRQLILRRLWSMLPTTLKVQLVFVLCVLCCVVVIFCLTYVYIHIYIYMYTLFCAIVWCVGLSLCCVSVINRLRYCWMRCYYVLFRLMCDCSFIGCICLHACFTHCDRCYCVLLFFVLKRIAINSTSIYIYIYVYMYYVLLLIYCIHICIFCACIYVICV